MSKSLNHFHMDISSKTLIYSGMNMSINVIDIAAFKYNLKYMKRENGYFILIMFQNITVF